MMRWLNDWRRRVFTRGLGIVLSWTTVVVAAAFAVNVVGIHVVGGVVGWQRWLHAHEGYFVAWRLVLYAGTAAVWLSLRKRVLQRAPTVEARHRLLRAELAAVIVVVLVEALRWLPAAPHA